MKATQTQENVRFKELKYVELVSKASTNATNTFE